MRPALCCRAGEGVCGHQSLHMFDFRGALTSLPTPCPSYASRATCSCLRCGPRVMLTLGPRAQRHPFSGDSGKGGKGRSRTVGALASAVARSAVRDGAPGRQGAAHYICRFGPCRHAQAGWRLRTRFYGPRGRSATPSGRYPRHRTSRDVWAV